MAQMKEHIKALEKIQLSNEEIANLSYVEFKTLIRMLTEMAEYSRKLEEEVKTMKVKQRKITREPTVKGRKPGLKSMVWIRRKK